MRNRYLSAVIVLLVAFEALAAEGYITRRKIEPAMFPQLAEVLQREMQTGGRFEFVTANERGEVEAALESMRGLLAGKSTIEQLNDDEKVALINAQERANAILTRRDGERLVCERRRVVGSNLRQNMCETYAERRHRVQGTRERARQLQKNVQICDDSGRCVSG
jgi:hypothetical protein